MFVKCLSLNYLDLDVRLEDFDKLSDEDWNNGILR